MSRYQWIESPHPIELGAIVHGPAILIDRHGIRVGLRSIVGYSQGLDFSVVIGARGEEAVRFGRQFSYERRPSLEELKGQFTQARNSGFIFQLASEDRDLPCMIRRSSRSPYSQPELYIREYDIFADGMHSKSRLVIKLGFPELGIEPTEVELDVMGPQEVQESIIRLV